MQFATTVIVSFHPIFLTKVDRAFNIQCLYSALNETVSSGPLDVRYWVIFCKFSQKLCFWFIFKKKKWFGPSSKAILKTTFKRLVKESQKSIAHKKITLILHHGAEEMFPLAKAFLHSSAYNFVSGNFITSLVNPAALILNFV